MVPQRLFEFVYAPIVKGHLKAIEPKYHSLIREAIEAQLRFEPDIETRNRKPLKRPVIFGTKWEIRCGPSNRFRVFYKVNHDDEQVEILAIGEKVGNRILIGGEEVQ